MECCCFWHERRRHSGGLERFSKYPVPGNVRVDISEYISRYGRVKMIKRDGELLLISEDALLMTELARQKTLKPYILHSLDNKTLVMDAAMRGHIKHALGRDRLSCRRLGWLYTGR